jgi:hypothetical protein
LSFCETKIMLLWGLVFGVFGLVSSQTSSSCPNYDASKIQLVTFDCFAALMSWEGMDTFLDG